GARKRPQDALALDLTVARQGPVERAAVHEQPNPVAAVQKGIGQRGGGLDAILEERAVASANIALPARVQDQADIGDALLLVLVDKQRLGVAGGRPGVDPARRVARLVLAQAVELDPWAALARRDLTGVDVRAPRPDLGAPQPD